MNFPKFAFSNSCRARIDAAGSFALCCKMLCYNLRSAFLHTDYGSFCHPRRQIRIFTVAFLTASTSSIDIKAKSTPMFCS